VGPRGGADRLSGFVGVVVLVAGLGVVVLAADMFVDGLLAVALTLGIAPFVLSVALSGFETENLATGIAANAKGLPGAAAGTFLGGVTFLALGVPGLGGLIAPIRVELPIRFAVWTAIAPLPLFAFAVDGHLSRIEGGLLVLWSVVALVGLAQSGRDLLADDDDEHVRRPGLKLLAGLALLTGGGWLIGEGLRTTVRQLGVPATLLGNTALAAAVEAEELARFAVPARRGRPEIGLGNISGTVVHFAALNAGIIALVKPLTLGTDTTRFYLPVAVASPAVLAAVLVVRKRLGRIEGAALTGLYVAYVAVAIAVSG
jgi:cation:H+ antiporter